MKSKASRLENGRAKDITRRTFLRRSAAVAAGAVGFPTIIPACAVGAQGFTPPSERIVIGLIGMGKQMRGHHGNLLGRRDVHVAALCDVESKRLDIEHNRNNGAYARIYEKPNYKGCTAYHDFRELVARSDIDAVLIATPNHWHSIPAIEAMRAGKDVYCEKPLARTIHEGKVMRDTARKYGRVFQTGSQQRSRDNFRFACELVRNGRIGELQSVHVNVGGPPDDCYLPAQLTPPGLDWDFWLGPAPWRPYHSEIAPGLDYDGWPRWRYYRDYAGGRMTDWGAHHFDIAQWGIGADDSGPRDVMPPGDSLPRLTYLYDNGVVLYHGGGTDGAGVEFIGSEGRVLVNRGFLDAEPKSLLHEVIGPRETHLYTSPDHHENWLDAIRTRKRPICDVEIGHRSATVCHIGNIAYWLKRPLRWDPAAETFENDAEANRLLSRPMRAPWQV